MSLEWKINSINWLITERLICAIILWKHLWKIHEHIGLDRVYWSQKLCYADNCYQFINSNNKCSCYASENSFPIYNSNENWKLMLTNFRNLLNRFEIIQEHAVLWTVFFSCCCSIIFRYRRPLGQGERQHFRL